MENQDNLLIFGASTRAAGFSALRAGLLPWCADLFADLDLQARCPTFHLEAERYPQDFWQLSRQEIAGPWMYTGGLENRRVLVQKIARERPLWGNDDRSLSLARTPRTVAVHLRHAGVPHPAVYANGAEVPRTGRWLVKPLGGAGGIGIGFWNGTPPPVAWRRRLYFQEYVEGPACSAAYVGDRQQARLLGVTRQLVGQGWLHAAPFRYCGSIGPLPLDPGLQQSFEKLGSVLAKGCRLRGLFGVDCILHDGQPWTVEVNPRYTASVEVLEYAAGVPALALHRQVFDRNAPLVNFEARQVAGDVVGKAILFAQAPLAFPAEGPWLETLRHLAPVTEMPAFADIPEAGRTIEVGRPILTYFVRADSEAACLDLLQRTAANLDRLLFPAAANADVSTLIQALPSDGDRQAIQP